MCLRPLHITNNTTSFRPIDKVELDCSCGDCEECRNLRKNEYELRIFAECTHKVLNKGYIMCFGTLTYKPECLPQSTIYPSNREPLTIECFSRKDISKLFNKLRKHFYKKFGVKGLSYIVVTEYGDSTQRPHYHFIVLFPSVCTAEYVHRWINVNWTFGFIFPRHHLGGYDSSGYYHHPFQTPFSAIQKVAGYISKYCCKDMAFYDKDDVKFYVNFLRSYMKRKDIDEHTYNYIRHYMLYDRLTFVHTSRHFGENINDYVNSVDDFFNGVQVPFKNVRLSIPNYNRRKLLFKTRSVAVDPSIKVQGYDRFNNLVTKYKVRYDLTDFGKKFFAEYVRKSIHKVSDTLNDFVVNWFNDPAFLSYADVYGFDSYLRNLFQSNIANIATYSVVYRNRCSPLHLQELIDFPNVANSRFRVFPDCMYAKSGVTWSAVDSSYYFRGDESIFYMRSVAENFYLSCLSFDKYIYEGIVNLKNIRGKQNVYFNSFPCFKNFDLMLNCIRMWTQEHKEKVKSDALLQRSKASYRQNQIEFVSL